MIDTAKPEGAAGKRVFDTTKNINLLLSEVMDEIGAIPKDADNSLGWKTRTIDAVYNRVHKLFAERGIITTSEVVECTRNRYPRGNGSMFETMLQMKYTFTAPNGTEKSTTVPAEGLDSSDKATNKALSYAHKNALLQMFTTPTEDTIDGDLLNPGLNESGESTIPYTEPDAEPTPTQKAHALLEKAWCDNDKKPTPERERALDEYGVWLDAQKEAGEIPKPDYDELSARLSAAYSNLPKEKTNAA